MNVQGPEDDEEEEEIYTDAKKPNEEVDIH